MDEPNSAVEVKPHFDEIKNIFIQQVGEVLKSDESAQRVSELFDNVVAPTVRNLLSAEQEYRKMTSELHLKLLEMDKAIESIGEGDSWKSVK